MDCGMILFYYQTKHFSILFEELVDHVAIVTQYTLQSLRPGAAVPAGAGLVSIERGIGRRVAGRRRDCARGWWGATLFWHASPCLVYPALVRALSYNPFSRAFYLSRTRIYISRYINNKLNQSLTVLGRSQRGVPLDSDKVQEFRFNDSIVVTIHHLYLLRKTWEPTFISIFHI